MSPHDIATTSSHLPVLRWAQQVVQLFGWGGSVLEYGGGFYSTTYLHDLDRHGYPTATIETDPDWFAYLAERFPQHHIEADADHLAGEWWDVVLIDHGGQDWIAERAVALETARGHCGIALVHDWHIGRGHRDDLVSSFPHYGWFAPEDGTMHTAICSERIVVAGATIPGGRVYTGWDDAPGAWNDEGVWPN